MLLPGQGSSSCCLSFASVAASVITQWLKQYDLRKVQYLAGHKYVSSTEDYKANVIDELQQLYNQYPTTITAEQGKNIPPQQKNILSRKRNKVILSLLIYQGLRVEEVAAFRLQDLQLKRR